MFGRFGGEIVRLLAMFVDRCDVFIRLLRMFGRFGRELVRLLAMFVGRCGVFLRLVVIALIVRVGGGVVMMFGGGVVAGGLNVASTAGCWVVVLVTMIVSPL